MHNLCNPETIPNPVYKQEPPKFDAPIYRQGDIYKPEVIPSYQTEADPLAMRKDNMFKANPCQVYNPPMGNPDIMAMYKQEPSQVYNQDPIDLYRNDSKPIYRANTIDIYPPNQPPIYQPNPMPVYKPEVSSYNPMDMYKQEPTQMYRQNPPDMYNQDPMKMYKQDPMQMYKQDTIPMFRQDVNENLPGSYQISTQKGIQEDDPYKMLGKQKKDEYRKYLELQMDEQKKKKGKDTEKPESQPVEILRHANTLASEEEAEKQKKLRSQQIMQEELKKQMEENAKRKDLEKQKQKEEEEKEMERIRKEREEVERKIKIQKNDDTRPADVNWAAMQKKKEFQPSADNPVAKGLPFGEFPKEPHHEISRTPVKSPDPVPQTYEERQPERNLFQREDLFKPQGMPAEKSKPEFLPQNPLSNMNFMPNINGDMVNMNPMLNNNENPRMNYAENDRSEEHNV